MIVLKNYSGLHVGGTADDILEMKDAGEVTKALKIIRDENLKPYVVGEGTNTFWSDGAHEKLVLLKYMGKSINVWPREDDVIVEAEAGASFDELVMKASEYGWGIEALAGIPGTVGAAPVQNIGAYGAEFADTCAYISGYDIRTGEKKIWQKGDCGFGYRTSIFNTSDTGTYLITRVQLILSRSRTKITKEASEATTPAEVAEKIRTIRAMKLPDHKVEFNCGSYFKNPIVSYDVANVILEKFMNAPHWIHKDGVKFSAAWLIESCGLKGAQLSPHVRISPMHALVMMTDGDSSCEELLLGEVKVCSAVFEKFGITLSREPNLVVSASN